MTDVQERRPGQRGETPDPITLALLARFDEIFPKATTEQQMLERTEQAAKAVGEWMRQTLARIEEDVNEKVVRVMHQRDATIDRLRSALDMIAEETKQDPSSEIHRIASSAVLLEILTERLKIEQAAEPKESEPVRLLIESLRGLKDGLCRLCGTDVDAHFISQPCGKTALWLRGIELLLERHIEGGGSVVQGIERICAERRKQQEARAILVSALEDITTADETSTVAGAVAIARKALESLPA